MTKTALKRKSLLWLTVSENESPCPIWQGAWKQLKKHDAGAVAQRFHPDTQAEVREQTDNGVGFSNLKVVYLLILLK